MLDNDKMFNKNILIAVDESDNARRAVAYVGKLLEGVKNFNVLILHVIRQPEEDYFPDVAEKDKCSTIVVGRQGLSRSEEFLFGSVSSKIVNHARNCTVWVVE